VKNGLVATKAGTAAADRAAGSRVGAAAVALFWAVLFFGIIDLMVAITPSMFPEFTRYMALESSWGLLYTCLIPMPLLAWAVRPVGWVGPQVLAIAVCVLVAGIGGFALGQVFVAVFMVAASASFPRMWRPPPRWAVPRSDPSSAWRAVAAPVFWPVDAAVFFGIGMAAVHAWDVLGSVSTAEDDNTWGLMHGPMQAGFALAVPVAAGVAVLAMANAVGGWWFAVVPPAVSAIWFGVVSVRYPDLAGSAGEVGGVLAICWGGSVAALTWGTGWLRRRLASVATS
jgi:hypothetical protein